MLRVMLFNQLMLLGQAEGQDDGAGVTDGSTICKSGLVYTAAGLRWLPKLDPKLPWMGHVRKASKGTQRPSYTASHPYYFSESGLIGAHNGFITLTGSAKEGEPDVDSWRALNRLSQLIGPNKEITGHTLNTWISGFGPYSEWAFMLLHKDTAWIVRGTRTMFWMRFADGHIFCTSYNALQLFQNWYHLFWGEGAGLGRIKEMDMHRAVRIGLDNKPVWTTLSAREQVDEIIPERYYELSNGHEQLHLI